MESVPLARAYLESLTTNDLLAVAENLGVDVSDNLDRILLIEELLEIASHDETGSFTFHESNLNASTSIEPVPLPKHYNITFIEVMIRDPLWAFVFWEIKSSDKEVFEKAQDFEGYYLKVSSVSSIDEENNPYMQENDRNFTVSVTPNDAAWYLSLSPDSRDSSSWMAQSLFKVEFCVKLGGNETVLAVSNTVRLPELPEYPSVTAKQENNGGSSNGAADNRLVRLSGFGDFHVLRKNERPLRIKRGEGESPNE